MKISRSILVIAIVTAALAEFAFRALSLYPVDSALFVNDPDIGFRMRPHSLVRGEPTNSGGFRDMERDPEKSENTHRVAFIGDSFVFGVVSTKDNFTYRFQKMAREKGADIEALNMGIPAAGPENYIALMKHDAADMAADTVCVVFFVGNDIAQSHPDFTTRVWLGATRETLRKPYMIDFSLEYFYLYRAGRTLRRFVQDRMEKDPSAAFSERTFLSIERQRAEIFEIDRSRFMEQCYRGAKNMLSKMAELAEKRNMGFFVVLAPDEIQVNDGLRRRVMDAYSLDPRRYDFKLAQKTLAAHLDSMNVPVLDLLNAFVDKSGNRALYMPRDTHWNEEGNRLAAEKILEFFLRRFPGRALDSPGNEKRAPAEDRSQEK